MSDPVRVGSAVQAFGSGAVTGGTVTAAADPGVTTGDHQLVWVVLATTGEQLAATPTGWLLLATLTQSVTTPADTTRAYLFASDPSADPGSATFSQAKVSGTRLWSSVRVAYRGGSGPTGAAFTNLATKGTSHALPQQATTTNNSVVVGGVVFDQSGSANFLLSTFTSPAGWTELVDTNTSVTSPSQDALSVSVAEFTDTTAGTVDGTFTSSATDDSMVWSVTLVATSASADVSGTATAALGFTATAAGVPETPGSALAALGFTATASGAVDSIEETGSAVAALGGLTATATGVRTTAGAATAAFTFAAAALGVGGGIQAGVATAALGFTATATGAVSFADGVEFLPDQLGASARLLVEIAWGADLAADSDTWTWTDVTRDVRVNPGVSATMGRSDEAGTSQPAACTLVLDNTSGDYSLGGLSSNWPNVRRNTPVRVQMNAGDGVLRTVFQGFADGFTPSWDSLTGQIPVVTLSASGTLRRLEQGNAPVQSAFRRAMATTSSVVAYWPFEEGEHATLAKNLRGGTDMAFTGEPEWAASTAFIGSAPLPVLQDGYFAGSVFPYANTGSQQVRFLIHVPAAGIADGLVIAHIHTTGSLSRFDITYEAGSGMLGVFIYNRDGSLRASSPAIGFAVNGQETRLSMEISQDGTAVDWSIVAIAPILGISPGGFGSTVTSATCGLISYVEINPHSNLGDVAFGHLTVENAITSLVDAVKPLVGYTSEYISSSSPGVSRLERVAAENDLVLTRYTAGGGNLTEYDRIGPQRIAPLLELLRDCELADQGQLWDGIDAGLSYSTRRYREHGDVKLTIDASAGELAAPFTAVDDDQRTRNRVEATRYQGVSATYEDVDGPQGTAAIGAYETSYTVNLFHDVMAVQHAAWRVHQGTTEGYRYPSVTLDAQAAPHLMADALTIVPGDRIKVTELDATLGGFLQDEVSLIVEGISHSLSASGWQVTFQCSPFSPWGIARAASTTGDTSEFAFRLDTSGSTVAVAATVGQLGLTVVTPSGPLWTIDDDDYPLTLSVGGVPVVATDCIGITNTQIFVTEALPINCAVGTPVSLYDPRPLGL